MSWLKRIFSRADEANSLPPAEARYNNDAKRLTFSEARSALYERLSADEANVLNGCAGLRNELLRIVGALRQTVDALARADVPEPKAAASKTIKDGFADRAQAALARVEISDWRNVTVALQNVAELERALASVSAGPREAMHLKFFFEAQMADIALQIHNAFGTIAATRNKLTPAAEKRKKIVSMLDEIESCTRMLATKREGISEAEAEITGAKNLLASIQFHNLSELQRLRNEIAKLENVASDVRQQIASGISPAGRLLKRYGHIVSDKHLSALIGRLDVAPADVFLESAEQVKSVLVNALAAVRIGQITTEEKELRRAELVLERFDEFISLRERTSATERTIREFRDAAERESVKERENSAANDKIRTLESVVAHAEMRTVDLKREIAESNQRLENLKRELADISAELIGKIEIEF